ncbi:hypothetical protein AUL39_07160 [Tractidigestivibacter scatoligenes]|uniref:Uncharacterized protein n=1 Tax=Tractidigestivibacter scatoligenes TaxID=1299998 RepID=A0A124EGN0_TRASO|nr:SpaA isopeptide-forming pilin-related protein [Tractidigestivibacter scatoligenes]KUH57999.1 hypothetical protein AUL39_07160 [Tractidigestivibacter scatoligenes]
MLKDNRRRHGLLGLAAVVGAAVAVVCTVLLMYPAHALTGGDALRNAINDDSAVFWRPAGADDDAWSKTDGGSAVDADAELRLRVAFTLPAGTLANGTTLQYKVPSSVHPDTSTGAIKGEVYASPTVGDPSRNGANAIGTYSLDGDVLTLTFNDDVGTANAGSAQGDGASDASADAGEKTASALNGYVDLDLGFDQLTCDDSGLASIELNDSVSLKVAKAAEEEASAQSADDSAATATVEATTDDEQDSAGVEAMSLMAAAPSATLADANGTGVDLTQYLKTVTVSKQQGNKMVPATEFNDGDQVETYISYKIPANVITATNRTARYQIPKGLKPNQELSGKITRNGEEIGDYTISTSGLVTLTFYDKVVEDGGAITGDVTFDGVVSNSSTTEDLPINFGNNSGQITIKKKQGGGGNEDTNHDVKVSKTSSPSDDNKTINYSVTISSDKGTSGPVSFTDYLNKYYKNNANPAYQRGSLQLVKISSSGRETLTPSSYGLSWNDNGTNGPTFSLGTLPQLKAGESYVLTYTVDVNATDSSAMVSNNANASSGNNSGSDDDHVEFKQDVSKTGTYYKDSNSIIWRLEINPTGKKDISNWLVTDAMPGGTKMSQYRVFSSDGQVDHTFTSDNDSSFNESNLYFNFSSLGLTGDQKTKTYYIDIYTDAPASDNTSFANTATTWTNSGKVESTGTVDVEHRTTNISKTHVSDVADATKAKGIRKETWSSDATLPEGNLSGMTYTYTDNIKNATDGNGTDLGPDSHYAIAADLDAALKGNDGLRVNLNSYDKYRYVGNGTGYYDDYYRYHDKQDVFFTVTYYDGLNCTGNTVDASNTTIPVKSFKVQVKIADGITFSATNMKIGAYPTYMDTTKVKEGESINAKNKGEIDNKESEPQVTYTRPHRILKSVKTGNNKAASGNKSFKLSEIKDGKLTYRINLATDPSDDNTTITVTDTLPKGMTYVDDSIRAAFFKDEYYEDTTNNAGVDLGKGKANAPQLTTSTTEDGGTLLTITIPNFHYDSNPEKQTIALYYDVSIKSDPSWNNGSTTKTYSNTAKWGESSSTQNTTVNRDEEAFSKSGEQVYDSDGNPTNDLSYYIEINPTATDLDPNSNSLTLTDTFNSNGIECSLDPSSVRLYAYDYSQPHHYDPNREVDGEKYSVKYDSKAHTITAQVPDGMACVLVYKYSLSSFANGAWVTNEASLNGQSSESKGLSLIKASSSAHANKARLVIYKVDADNFHKQLKGAKFKLYQWDNSQQAWVEKYTNRDLVTDDNGAITYDLEEDADSLDSDVLYKLVEVAAPAGYSGNSVVRYFIIKNVKESDSDDSAFSKANAGNAKDDSGNYLGLQTSSVEFFDNNVISSMYVPNEYTSLTVKKSWADEKGYSTSAPIGSFVKLTLNRTTDYSASVKVIGEGSNGGNANPSVSLLQGNGVSDGTVKVKNGSDFSFNVGYGWNQSFSVYVNDKKYGDFTAPTSVTVEGKYISGATTIEVKMNNWDLPTLTANSDKPWTAPPEGSSSTAETVVLSDSNNWTNSWDNLPKTDDKGNTYNYTVTEVSYTVNGTEYTPGTGSYDVSYTNNNGIQTGTITVTNSEKKNQGYELPSTGGTPSPLPWVGGTLAALAGVLLVRRMRPRKS